MHIPILSLPKAVPVLPQRQPQVNIPQTRAEREWIHVAVRRYVTANRSNLVPPLVMDELRTRSEEMVSLTHLDAKYRDYIAVLLSNEVWREHLATVPYERRLLLLPKCLRVEDRCPAPFDEFGLLCKQCGLCSIQDLQEEAERLGYAVLVAEGSAIVMSLIQTGKIDAIVGVSCLSVLERAFPYMEAAAIPGIAIPLLQDDCKDTGVDIEWVWDVLHLNSDDQTRRLDLDALRAEVRSWFAPEAMDEIFGGPANSRTEEIGREWLARDGKRWRPFLTACAYRAMLEDSDAPLPADLRKVAMAVECFHKASLIHDDIEDEDAERYVGAALHTEHGTAVALNVGDYLLGEGYRLIGDCEAPAEHRVQMLQAAAAGHRTLSLGQGAELCWACRPEPLSVAQVLDIFRQKTAPAFEVALRLGTICAGRGEEASKTLARYSEALGIAYQVRDDLEDLSTARIDDVAAMRPSLPLAIAWERASGESKKLLERFWRRAAQPGDDRRVREALAELKSEDRCRGLLEAYKEEAVRCLKDVEHASLKGLLRRVIGKIFMVEIQGWCSEFEARNAASRAAGAEIAG